MVVPYRYDEAGFFAPQGYVAPVRLGQLWYFITPKGKQIPTLGYDAIEDYHWRSWLVCRQGKWGLVNDYGQEIAPCQYEDIRRIDEESRLVFGMVETPVRRNGRWGLLDNKGREILACQYDDVRTIHNGHAEVRVGNQWHWVRLFTH
ncbi:hypothetical protein GCM10023187_52630 [Nibrella viscosa]|uniref:WG containing repeat-containing protein n=1 Tax=Nibrella viscosa TaxID=1084524 RepID=A0ABP8KYR1_9BACT